MERAIRGRVVLPPGAPAPGSMAILVQFDEAPAPARRETDAHLRFAIAIPHGVTRAKLELQHERFYQASPLVLYGLDESPPEVELVAEAYGAIEVRVGYGEGAVPSSEPLVVELREVSRMGERVLERSTRTCELRDGSCVFDRLPGERGYVVSCAPAEHPPLREIVVGPRGGETKVVELELGGVGEVYGHVTTETDEPIPGVEISAETRRGSEAASVQTSAFTDDAGGYRLTGVPSGEITLIAELPAVRLDGETGSPLELRYPNGSSRFSREIGWLGAGDELLVDLTAPGMALLRGRVRWADGRMAGDAWFHARSEASEPTSEAMDLTARLGAEGRFAFRAPPGATLEVFVFEKRADSGAFGFASWSGSLEAANAASELDLVLECGGPVQGRVEDDAGAPIAAFRLSWIAESPGGIPTPRFEASIIAPDGRFELCIPPGGRVSAYAVDEDAAYLGNAVDSRVLATEATVTMVLQIPRSMNVRGVVTSGQGRLLNDVGVLLEWWELTPEGNPGSWGQLSARTDGQGAFAFDRIGLPPCHVQVRVADDPGTAVDFALAPGETRDDLVLEL